MLCVFRIHIHIHEYIRLDVAQRIARVLDRHARQAHYVPDEDAAVGDVPQYKNKRGAGTFESFL